MSDELKRQAAEAALKFLPEGETIGIGSGSTVYCFIEALAKVKHLVDGAVCASKESEERVKALGIPVVDLNTASDMTTYFDGADEINPGMQMIKGGGGAQTREKIIASCAQRFICLAHESKRVKALGAFPIAVEVLPIARSFVGRELYKLGANLEYREGFTTDEGNLIIDAYDLPLKEPIKLEETLNNIPGVVGHGLFAKRKADKLILAKSSGVEIY